MRKALLIIVAAVVAFSAIPVTFACYTWGWGYWRPYKPIAYCSTLECSVAFISVQADDNEDTFPEPKDVADTAAFIADCGKKIVVTVNNAYPGYEGIVDFCVKNKGSLPATITSIIIDNPNPGYLQLDLTGECVVGVVIQPCETKCGHLVIYGIPQLPDAQNRTLTFDITINFACIPKPCETAYAYCGHCCSQCFTAFSFSNWGWTNGPLKPGSYTFYIYAGVGGCNPANGKKVGWLTVNYNGTTVTVTYHMYPGYKMTATHLYVGTDPLPKKNGQYTVSPGQYPYKHDLQNGTTDSYMINGFSGQEIYIVAHADVCW